MRLAFCEPAGAWTLPYAESFLTDFEKNHCYDRFWSETTGTADTPAFAYPRCLNTRYLLTNNALCLATEAPDQHAWVLNPEDGLLAHSQRHYFQLFLLAQVQHAALLVFSDQLAEAVEQEDDTNYHRDISRIAREFARFIDRLWVGELTNQIQGSELFARLVAQMRSEQLFSQVKEEINYVYQYLANERAEEMAHKQERLARSQEKLAQAAYWGLAAGTVVSALGMNILLQPLEDWWKSQGFCSPAIDWLVFGSVLLPIGALAWILWNICFPKHPEQPRHSPR
jgi:hypothetical protein